SEPCALVGTGDMGQEVSYRELVKKLPAGFPYYKCISSIVASAQDVHDVETRLNLSLPQPTLVLLNITTSEDVSFLIDDFNTLRLKYSTAFLSVIFSDIRSLYSALES